MNDFKITECVDCTTEITGGVKIHAPKSGARYASTPRRHFISYAVETDGGYCKFETKAEALEEYKSAVAPKELYGVDKYGLCHTMKKSGKFAWE